MANELNVIGPTSNLRGGTITTSGGNTIHTFTTSGTFTPNRDGTVNYLVVGGGGGGGGYTGVAHTAGGNGGNGIVIISYPTP